MSTLRLILFWVFFQYSQACISSLTGDDKETSLDYDYYEKFEDPNYYDASNGRNLLEEGCSGNVIKEVMGPDVKITPYESSTRFEVVSKESQLDCDFDSVCCWNNIAPPIDLLEFNLGEGKIDRMTEGPDGKYLVAASPCGEKPDVGAQFVSCTIPCTEEKVRVSLMHWRTNEIKLEVCKREAFFNNPEAKLEDCAELPLDEAPGPSVVELPKGETFDVVIVATNMAAPSGDIAIIDNIRVDYILCPSESSEESTTEASTEEPETTTEEVETTTEEDDFQMADEEECAAIECDFEDGSICSYTVVAKEGRVRRRGDSESEFANRKGRLNNHITGIARAAEGDHYAAVYLKKLNLAIMRTVYTLKYDRVIRLKYYEATKNMELFGCCVDADSNAAPDCTALSKINPVAIDRQWHKVQFVCEAGTDEIMFMCSSMDTENQGACGVDDVKLFVYDEILYVEDDPESLLPEACALNR